MGWEAWWTTTTPLGLPGTRQRAEDPSGSVAFAPETAPTGLDLLPLEGIHPMGIDDEHAQEGLGEARKLWEEMGRGRECAE